jgi:hypothetical protein
MLGEIKLSGQHVGTWSHGQNQLVIKLDGVSQEEVDQFVRAIQGIVEKRNNRQEEIPVGFTDPESIRLDEEELEFAHGTSDNY